MIPVRDDAARLGLCLEALAAQSWPGEALQVVVVDDGSRDDPGRACAGHPGVELIRQPGRGSYAARNRALEVATGTIIAFTDADCLPRPDWILEGVRHVEKCASVGLVAGEVEMFPATPGRPSAVEWVDMFSSFDQRRCLEELRFGATANLFTRRAVIEELGTFDPTLESGGDMEWGQRVWRAGRPLVYCPDAVVTHPARATWAAVIQRACRVARGQHALATQHGLGRDGFLLALRRLVRTPLRTAARFSRHPQIEFPGLCAKVVAGLVAVHLATWWTRLRLATRA